MNASDVVKALRVHYGDGHALVEQVGNGTGFGANRHLDVVAVGLWPSRGMEIVGIEVKVSRADLKRELAKPDKAEPVAKFCDKFYLAGPADLFDDLTMATLDAIAPGWGVLSVGPKGVSVARQAAKQDAEPLTRTFVAALLRRLPVPSEALRDEIRQAVFAEFEARYAERVEHEVKRRLGLHEVTAQSVADFEAATGIDLAARNWSGGLGKRYGEAVRVIDEMRDRFGGSVYTLQSAGASARRDAEQLLKVADSIDAVAEIVGSAVGRRGDD